MVLVTGEAAQVLDGRHSRQLGQLMQPRAGSADTAESCVCTLRRIVTDSQLGAQHAHDASIAAQHDHGRTLTRLWHAPTTHPAALVSNSTPGNHMSHVIESGK